MGLANLVTPAKSGGVIILLGLKILALIGLAIVMVAPLAQSVLLSFMSTLPRDDMAVGTFTLLNYRNLFADPALIGSFGNSLTYVTFNIVICLAAGLPAAYAISRFSFVGDRHFLLMLLALRITPPVVLSLPVFLLFAKLNLLNNPIGIALVHCLFNIPVTIWILESFISTVPKEFDETAFLDGYSTPEFFVKFLLPIIAPGIAVAAFFCFIFSWVEVVLARILTSTGSKPIPMAIESLFGFQTDVGLVMAVTILSLLPGILLIFFVRNHVAKGFQLRI
ncbi:Trehalose transport system permease protein SugB [Nereida ignava]|uniref:Trehalose transport system permease protein SugB n=2 Tax=Nereida ignava TaxID=282199 RepID=A0A0U1NNZ8_9RHOB|nr:Trehalose transport system permease protein SugB [Nereida ignava]SFJ85826.1 carbohydrate ABC transporter membrane protein 2, CUT1 family [Nereida ignava DSM 16309]